MGKMTSAARARIERKLRTACANTPEANARKGRSRVTNGAELLPTTPGTSVWARLMRDVIASMQNHLGGEDNVSEPQRMLVRRVGAFEAELVHFEDKFARVRSEGGAPAPTDIDLYSKMASAQRRLLEAIGLSRVSRDCTPDLQSYMASKEYTDELELEPEDA